MTAPDSCGCDDCGQDQPPAFLDGGDDLATKLREMAFGLLLATRSPVEAANLAALTGADESIVRAALDGLAEAGRIDRDDRNWVIGSAGLTLGDGPHRLELYGHLFRTWCAFDALGIPASLAADGRVDTACGVCGRPIRVKISGGLPDPDGSPRLWLSAGGDDMRADFCTPTVILCSETHTAEWARRQAAGGQSLPLAEAAHLGARDWASAAAAAIRIRAAT